MSKIEVAAIDSDSPFDATELGAMLREMRVGMQRDLKEVAQELHIRQPYLEAIEDGRLDDLPGPAYTTGFLRAYSNYLGLDSKEIVDQFKHAGIDIDRRTSLTLPSPLEEGRLPTGSILMVSALLAIVAYAGWYFISTDDRSALDQVVAAPPDMVTAQTGTTAVGLTTVGPAPTTATTSSPPTSAASDVLSAVGGAQSPAAAAVVAPPPAAAPVQAAANTDTPPAGTIVKEPPAQVQAPVAPPEPPAETIALARDVTMDLVASAAPPALPLPLPPVAQPVATPAVTAAAGSSSAPGTPPPGQQATQNGAVVTQVLPAPTQIATSVPGPNGAKSMIKVVAVADSWVEIRGADGKSLFSRLMRNGESHELESRPGLVLVTGNAGGVQLQVDGKAVPPLGPAGQILQDVAVDAASLRARVATTP